MRAWANVPLEATIGSVGVPHSRVHIGGGRNPSRLPALQSHWRISTLAAHSKKLFASGAWKVLRRLRGRWEYLCACMRAARMRICRSPGRWRIGDKHLCRSS